MPFYLRKAISAGPFRFNLSKSGVGLSVGVKGLRFGVGPRGNYIHAGRGGLYYRTSLGRAGQKVLQPPPSQDSGAGPPSTPLPDQGSVEMVEVDSGDVLAMRDARFSELLDEIDSKQKQIAYATMFGVGVGAVGLGVIYLGSQIVPYFGSQVGVYVLLLALPAWAIGRWVDSYKRRSVLFYDLDQDAAKAYEAMTHAFDEMMSCAGKWHIEAKGAIRDLTTWKRNAGATSLVRLKPAQLAYATPKIIASNITPPSARLGRQTAYFFPDAAFVIDGKRVGAVSYDDLGISAQPSSFIEEGTVPADANVISHTWKYPNKSGGPDRRFSNNYQIPVCLYEVAHFNSSSGLNELLEFSRTGVVTPFAKAIKNLSFRMGTEVALKQSPVAAEKAREPKPVRPPQSAPITKSITQSQSGAIVPGDGSYQFQVVGESHYQTDLEHIVGGRTQNSASYRCVGILTPEPDNPYDPQAVYVSVDGRKVGYLSRDWRQNSRPPLPRAVMLWPRATH